MDDRIKVLIVSPNYPYPDYTSGLNKINANLLAGSAAYSADMLTPVYDEDERHFSGELEGVKYYKVRAVKNTKLRWLSAAEWFFSNSPLNIIESKKNIFALRDKLIELAPHYDVIHLSSHFAGLLLLGLPDDILCKCILFQIDSLTMFAERRMSGAKSGIKKLLLGMEKRRRESFERKIFRRSKLAVFVSNVDAEYSENISKGLRTDYIPNGVDVERFKPGADAQTIPNTIIFTGNFIYDPNINAAEFIINDLMPLLIEEIPDIKMYFAGINQSEKYLRMKDENIIFLGKVDDIRGVIENKALYIAPLEYGSGIKNKVLEAMSLGKIVIGSPVSFEGIEGANGREFICIEKRNARAWADAIVNVLRKHEEYSRIGKNARILIEDKYSWKGIRERYGELYKNFVKEL